VRPLVDAGNGEGATCPCGRLFEQQSNIQPVERTLPDARLLLGFELRRQRQQFVDLVGLEIQKLEERTSLEVNSHVRLLVRTRAGG
jgi:hypothetical protein